MKDKARPLKAPDRGFTLIELAIVITIVAFIAGGIVIGRSMIRQSELMDIITSEDKYVKAAYAFRDKYNALPGDMGTATSYWGTNTSGAGCPATTFYNTPQIATCNGNGNGIIDSSGTGAAVSLLEGYYAWQHLSDAGLIKGTFTGARGPSANTDNRPGINVPATKMINGGFEWMSFNASSAIDTTALFNIVNTQQYLLLGAASGGYDLFAPLLTPSDALTIDSKIDDGLPGKGAVTSITGTTVLLGYTTAYSSCVTTSNADTSVYMTSTTAPSCILLFLVKW